MNLISDHNTIRNSIITVSVGSVGALIGYFVSLPLYPIIGPAIAVSLVSLTGLKTDISIVLRDVVFIFLGINIGSGVDPGTLASIMKWPLAFVLLSISLAAIIVIGTYLLTSVFRYERGSSVLASSPGHLSYVLGLATAHGSDVTRISILQSLRLLLLTLSVPFIANSFGVNVGEFIVPAGQSMKYHLLLLVVCASAIAGLILYKLRVPAAFLLGGMLISTLGHASDGTPGAVPNWLLISSFIVLGSLIGSRFSGLTFSEIKKVSLAGAFLTTITILISATFAVPTAYFLDAPIIHVLLAFAPGGLETMIIMGSIIGADPAFLAACHVTRLFLLSAMVPFFVALLKD